MSDQVRADLNRIRDENGWTVSLEMAQAIIARAEKAEAELASVKALLRRVMQRYCPEQGCMARDSMPDSLWELCDKVAGPTDPLRGGDA